MMISSAAMTIDWSYRYVQLCLVLLERGTGNGEWGMKLVSGKLSMADVRSKSSGEGC